MRAVGCFRLAWGPLLALALAAALGPPAAGAAPWAELSSGERGEYRWSVSLGGHPDAGRPCLFVASSWSSGPLERQRSTYRDCADSPLRQGAAPLIATSIQTGGAAATRRSAVGMAFASSVRKVRITLAGGRELALVPSKPDRARGGASSRLRFVAFTVRGVWCAERIVSRGVGGAVLWDSGVDQYICSETAQAA